MEQTHNPNNVPKNFIWLLAELEIEPTEFSIVAANDEVVPGWVDVHAGNPFTPGCQRF